MDPITIVLLIVAIVIGLVLGFIVNRLIASSSSKNAAREAASLVEDAKKQAETLRREAAVEAKDEALRYKRTKFSNVGCEFCVYSSKDFFIV